MYTLFWKIFGVVNITLGFWIFLWYFLFMLSGLINGIPARLLLNKKSQRFKKDIYYMFLFLWSGFYLFNNAEAMASLFNSFIYYVLIFALFIIVVKCKIFW